MGENLSVLKKVVEARHLEKRYGPIIAVDDVSFDVFEGECFGILGPNGAGKTTTIRMVYGFFQHSSGILNIFGLEMLKNMRQIKSRIGVCQQENSLDPDLTVMQNLEVFASYFNIRAEHAGEKAKNLLQFMSLDHKSNTRTAELSGGMMRRLVIARALINQPQLLVLDEPTTGLDPQSRHQVWSRLEELKNKGLSILLTTHYMDEAARLCDRLVIMDEGKILVEGRPKDLISEHVGSEVIEVNDPGEDIRKYVKENNLGHEDLGYRLIVFGNGSDDIYRNISAGFCHTGCRMRLATLEDVFLKLTGRELRD
jgi:lipooligosaccharide transport system ATP-binding protein